ncbi:MAG: sigma-70 family RNA polymerase sigma factor [Alphaproteobacteria bacterium TMED89]|nr:hypothetical protein [Rhodospirillaceae bacterium]RPH15771.1 MAG: sigma-70 family RNA polymerase sigma factor [Alphaproteobacteria bacterium TMED89]
MDLDQTDFSALYAGDDRAWSRFVLMARPVLEAAVQRTLRRQGLTPDAGLFQDAVADTLERLAAKQFALLRRFDPARGRLSAFLAVVAGSTAANTLRAARRHPSGTLDNAPEPVDPAPARRSSIRDVVPEGLVTDREMLVLVLSFDRDLDGPDIAQALAISDNTVRVLKARALKKLRQAGIQPDGTFASAAVTDDKAA